MNYTAALIGGAMALMVTSAVETALPVVVSMKAVGAQIDESRTFTAHVEGRKIRECSIVANSFAGWYFDGKRWIETPFAFIDDPSPNSTRPSLYGAQDFGKWAWYGLPESAKLVRLSMQHECSGKLELTTAPAWGGFEVTK